MLALLYDNNSTNPLRDPNFSSTLFGDQTLSSNSSSISTSLDDDNSLFDIPSKALQMNQHQDPLLVSPLLSISSYPPTPIDACLQSAVSSPISSDDNSVVVSPIANDQTATISNLAATQRHSPSINNTSSSGQGSISSENANNVNSQQRQSSSSTDQTSYGSINNVSNSRQRPISSRGNDANSHVTTQQRPNINLSATSLKIEQGSIGSDNSKPLPIAQRRSSSFKLISNQSVSSTLSNNRHFYILSGFLPTSSTDNNSQPRRSSTSTVIPSQSVTQNEQYGSINISSLGQGNITSSRPIAQLRRSSTSNVTTARSITATTSQAYSPFSIDKNKLAYLPSVATTQYSVDGYSLVGHGEAGSGAVTFTAKYHPIQPKAGKSNLS
jgi:hypothetical protein